MSDNFTHDADPRPETEGVVSRDPAAEQVPSPSPAPAPAPVKTPTRLNPSRLRARREQENRGQDFTLYATTDDDGNPTVVTVKRPSLFDSQNIKMLPTTLQRSLMELVNRTEEAGGEVAGDDLDVLIENFSDAGDIARIYCIFGFLEPRCYGDLDEAIEKDGVFVDDIDESDRLRFMGWCQGRVREVSEPLEAFRPGSHDDVSDRPAGAPVSEIGESERGPEDSSVGAAFRSL